MKWSIKTLIIALAAVFSLSSCEYEDEYIPSKVHGSNTVYFDKAVQSFKFYPSVSEVTVNVCREDASKAETYQLIATCDSIKYLDIPSEITFNKDESSKDVTIKIKEDFPFNVTINLNLALEADDINIYRNTLSVIKLFKEEPYKTIAHGIYTNAYTGEGLETILQYSSEKDCYRIVNPYGENSDNIVFTFDKNTNTGIETSSKLNTPFVHSEYGEVFMLSPYAFSKDESKKVNIQYDAATNTYSIIHYICVSAGTFGAFEETFEVTSEE